MNEVKCEGLDKNLETIKWPKWTSVEWNFNTI